ncbi:MAG: peptidylprolyl isomerase, partial [candidate division Zixibacteria bacterium]|nr:peptidylprolyl isomerase [candidate division Zixibacteria bacterium]
MFETLRRMILPIIVIVLVFFVAMIVLDWGLSYTGGNRSMGSGGESYAAEINGEKVPLEYYNRIYDNLYKAESQKSAEELTDDAVVQLRQQAWSELLQDRLLLQEAAKHDIVVTDKDIFNYLASQPPSWLQSVPQFQTDGQFDYQKYMQAMADPKTAPFWNQLEPVVQTDLLKGKMQQQIVAAASVSEQDIRQAVLDQKEMIKVAVVNIPVSSFMSIVPTPADSAISRYYDQHKDRYGEDEKAALEIAVLSKDPSELDMESSRSMARTIYDSIVAGTDFATMAGRYSEDPGSKDKGGDLGWFESGTMTRSFDSISFHAKEGDLVPPFRTEFGWHILKHHGYRTEERPAAGTTAKEKVKIAHVSHILIRTVQSQETKDQIHQKLSAFSDQAREKGFTEAARELGIMTQTTPPFLKGNPIQTLGRSDAAHAFAFSHKVGDISGVLETPNMFFVARVSERIPAGTIPLDKVKARVINHMKQELARRMAGDTAAVISQEIKNGGEPSAVASRHNA